MNTHNVLRWTSAALCLAVVAACTSTPPAAGAPAAPVHESIMLTSRSVGENRLINVRLPRSYSTASQRATRYPVLYMPDGGVDEDFPHVVATVDSLIAHGMMREVIVVGIPNTQRRRDLTGPTRFAKDSAIAPKVGGSAAFRAFLRDELVPAIDARYRTTDDRGIMGESLAGLFVLETMLFEPELFRHYIAFDASLWWNESALLDTARVRFAAPRASPTTLRMASSGEKGIADDMERFAKVLEAADRKNLTWSYTKHPELTHATIYRALKPRALIATYPPR